MTMSFQPHSTQPRPCWHCRYFDGMTGPAALCTLPNAARVRSVPQWGCSGFEREPGADDETPAVGLEPRAYWQGTADLIAKVIKESE